MQLSGEVHIYHCDIGHSGSGCVWSELDNNKLGMGYLTGPESACLIEVWYLLDTYLSTVLHAVGKLPASTPTLDPRNEQHCGYLSIIVATSKATHILCNLTGSKSSQISLY